MPYADRNRILFIHEPFPAIINTSINTLCINSADHPILICTLCGAYLWWFSSIHSVVFKYKHAYTYTTVQVWDIQDMSKLCSCINITVSTLYVKECSL